MKAVIVEIRAAYAAALTDDGCVMKLKNRNYTIGETIEVSNTPVIQMRSVVKWASSVAAAVILCVVSAWTYWAPYSYVSLDVNPSIEYQVNRFDRVIGVQAVNGDGDEIIQSINVTNNPVDQAVKTTIDQIAANGYLDEDFCGIVISTSCKNEKKAGELAEQLQRSAEEEARLKSSSVIVETVSVDEQQRQQAKDMGVTPGKLNLVEKLQESTEEDVAVEEWLNKSVKDIMQATQKNQEEKENSSAGGGENSSSTSSDAASAGEEVSSSGPAGELAPSGESHEPSSGLAPPDMGQLVPDESGTGGVLLPPESFPSVPSVVLPGELGSQDSTEQGGASFETSSRETDASVSSQQSSASNTSSSQSSESKNLGPAGQLSTTR